MRVAATRTLPSCINSNIAPVAFFESRGAPGDYAGGVVAGLVNNYIFFFWKACYNHQSRKTASRTRH